MSDLVIIGASYAGTQLALAARANGFAGGITMIGDEPHLPYQRPPLSKGFLRNEVDASSLPLQSPERFAEERIVLRTGVAAHRIDREACRVELSDGSDIGYGHLALTTGARCRTLACEGAGLGNVHYLRGLADACAIRDAAGRARRVAVIGGGFIGLEAAAALRSLGCEVTVVEMQERLLQRAVPPLISTFLMQAHAQQGVRLRLSSRVGRLLGQGTVEAVELESGEVIAADMVVAGLGVVPNVELAQACGLAIDNGIVVDRYARTSDPDIVAAGDCASYPNPWLNGLGEGGGADAGRCVRVESIQSANDLARVAGATVSGQTVPYDAVPWFWSDQYGYKLQMVGTSNGHDHAVVRGNVESGRFTALYLRAGTLIGADSVNRPVDHMAARRLIAARVQPDPAALRDEAVALKTLMPA
ncbi:FAD-dependent oxidoreductase (plasmid) [Cupriavidus pinatubonensis]|uniref:NAD(P)/FAD-dependent oxidoreductase n=1 Tax=Cupriavidus pinatubonensis TaxID=248026 RepID=UPI001C732066|nr:FAD-dependent oxidoreductase [Cupriavidus pinatubonensis]QYY34018.1 FAD-dependent oxidoreductase [Cupriavidus pinatubonensis]